MLRIQNIQIVHVMQPKFNGLTEIRINGLAEIRIKEVLYDVKKHPRYRVLLFG